ncbi:hypothetical protein Tco_1183153 [Tanacetum coccineum]
MAQKKKKNIIRVLHVFYLASGLKINIHKSNIYGIGVNEDEVYNMASNAGCIAGCFDNNGCSFKGTWANIVGSSNFLHSKGIILNNSFRFNAGCGTRIRFWKDIWVGEAPLSIRTNIGVRNLAFFRDMLNEIGQLNIVASEDTCVWNLGPNGTFTVKDAHNIIDQKTIPSFPSTSWDKIIPRKKAAFLSRLLPRGLFGVSSKTTSK